MCKNMKGPLKGTLERVRKVFLPDRRHSAYVEYLKVLNPPCVPWLEHHFHQAKISMRPSSSMFGLINFDKCVNIYNVIEELMQYQQKYLNIFASHPTYGYVETMEVSLEEKVCDTWAQTLAIEDDEAIIGEFLERQKGLRTKIQMLEAKYGIAGEADEKEAEKKMGGDSSAMSPPSSPSTSSNASQSHALAVPPPPPRRGKSPQLIQLKSQLRDAHLVLEAIDKSLAAPNPEATLAQSMSQLKAALSADTESSPSTQTLSPAPRTSLRPLPTPAAPAAPVVYVAQTFEIHQIQES